jgi:prepilin-type N-terminal cleavage/methylation domain-containing protein
MQRLPPPRRRRAFTLLELLVVLVMLGLAAAFVLPVLQRPLKSSDERTVLERARAVAVRRGESVRLEFDASGAWTVRATADTTGAVLLSGQASTTASDGGLARSTLISALGACLPEGAAVLGGGAWDPTRCAVARDTIVRNR